MPGTRAGGLKARDKNLAKNPDFYRIQGSKGGSAPHRVPRGFAAMPKAKVQAAGALGGRKSKRIKKGA